MNFKFQLFKSGFSGFSIRTLDLFVGLVIWFFTSVVLGSFALNVFLKTNFTEFNVLNTMIMYICIYTFVLIYNLQQSFIVNNLIYEYKEIDSNSFLGKFFKNWFQKFKFSLKQTGYLIVYNAISSFVIFIAVFIFSYLANRLNADFVVKIMQFKFDSIVDLLILSGAVVCSILIYTSLMSYILIQASTVKMNIFKRYYYATKRIWKMLNDLYLTLIFHSLLFSAISICVFFSFQENKELLFFFAPFLLFLYVLFNRARIKTIIQLFLIVERQEPILREIKK